MTAPLHAGWRARSAERTTTPVCPTTPGGIPIRLLVDAAPRSRARRALPLAIFLALGFGVAAVALAGGEHRDRGAPEVKRAPDRNDADLEGVETPRRTPAGEPRGRTALSRLPD